MEWLEALRGTVVGVDTAPLIYLIEENPIYLPFVRPFFEAVHRGEFRVTTSVLTLTEVLVHPMRHGDQELADQYRQILLQASEVTTVPVSEMVAEKRPNCAHAMVCERKLFNWPRRFIREHLLF
jgi:hypothetical protein